MCVSTAHFHRPAAITRLMPREWLSFLVQIGLVASVEVGDDLIRGMVAEHDSHTGIVNAVRVVQFEAAHGFWVEPGWQEFFRRTHHLLGLTLGWAQTVNVVNALYTVGHVCITLAFALWVFVSRRSIFAFVRNIFFISNACALVLYETYPMAPPRLTTGLKFDGHPYRFIDSLFQVLGADGKVVGTKIGYNEFAAMPSVHIAWALIVGVVVACAARPLALRLLALAWPVLMLITVVVTGNHYIMDAVGAAGVVGIATIASVLIYWWRGGYDGLGATLHALWHTRHGESAATAQSNGTRERLLVPGRAAA